MLGKWLVALFLLLLLALGLRLYALDAESLWADEAFTVHHAQEQDYNKFMTLISTTEAAPPGHYLFLHYWLWWFGNSEFSVRFPSVLFGVAAVAVLFLIVRQLGNEKMALLASLFMATSMLQVLFSQEARLYSLFTLLVLLAVYCLLNSILQEKKWLYFWGYLAVMALALTVNYLAIVVMALAIVMLWFAARNKKISELFFWRCLGLQGILLLALGWWLGPIFTTQFAGLNQGLSEALVRKGLPSFLAGFGLFFYALPVLALTLSAGLLIWIRPTILRLVQRTGFDTFFSFLVIGAGSVYLYVSFFPLTLANIPLLRYPLTHSYFLIRHSFFLVPLWYVFLAWKISSLRWKHLAVLMTIIILMVSGTALYEYYTQTTKAEWREATAFIAEQSKGAPLILLDKSGFSNIFLLNYYYPDKYHLLKLTFSDKPREFSQLADEEVLSRLRWEREFWLVLAGNTRTGYHYRDLLDQHYVRDVPKQWYQIEGYHYHNSEVLRKPEKLK